MKAILIITPLDKMAGGGVPVYTAHLYHSFAAIGLPVVLVRLMRRDLAPVTYTHGIRCERWSLARVVGAVQGGCHAVLATSTSSADSSDNYTHGLVAPLLDMRVPVVIHDQVEFYPALLDAVRSTRCPVITIREAVRQQLAALGVDGVFIRHPYVTVGGVDRQRTRHAVAATRVSHRKRTRALCMANDRLGARAIELHGAIDRPYKRTLDQSVPGWERYYFGPYPFTRGAAVHLLSEARVAVDFTQLTGDGGGTQYAMLEAWDAGTPLIVHADWMMGDPGLPVAPVADVDALVALLDRPDPAEGLGAVVEEGRARLRQHAPHIVVPRYREVLGWT